MLGVMEIFALRRKVLVEGQSQRSVVREMGLARDTGYRYLATRVPKRQQRQRFSPVLRQIRLRPEQPLEEWSYRTTAGSDCLMRLLTVIKPGPTRIVFPTVWPAKVDRRSEGDAGSAVGERMPQSTTTSRRSRVAEVPRLGVVRVRSCCLAVVEPTQRLKRLA